jgi:hypothetical protein
MQRVRQRFHQPDGGKYGSLQSCVRTNDLDLVGDGTHLSSFQMLGNFSFGGDDYEQSVELWHSLLRDLNVPVDEVHCYPERLDHRRLWVRRGYHVVPDEQCQWSAGTIGGHCCELYNRGLELGNLVNPLGHSTDVGFGWERLVQVIEGKERVDQTSLFRPGCHPVVSDHERTLEVLQLNGIQPGNKGREYVCRRLVRRLGGAGAPPTAALSGARKAVVAATSESAALVVVGDVWHSARRTAPACWRLTRSWPSPSMPQAARRLRRGLSRCGKQALSRCGAARCAASRRTLPRKSPGAATNLTICKPNWPQAASRTQVATSPFQLRYLASVARCLR